MAHFLKANITKLDFEFCLREFFLPDFIIGQGWTLKWTDHLLIALQFTWLQKCNVASHQTKNNNKVGVLMWPSVMDNASFQIWHVSSNHFLNDVDSLNMKDVSNNSVISKEFTIKEVSKVSFFISNGSGKTLWSWTSCIHIWRAWSCSIGTSPKVNRIFCL